MCGRLERGRSGGESGHLWYGGPRCNSWRTRVVTPLLERTVRSTPPSFGKRRRSIVATGTIKKVVADRGFGFIAAEDKKEYFFHRGGLDSSLDFDRLVGGEKVEFEVTQSPKGPRAEHVRAA